MSPSPLGLDSSEVEALFPQRHETPSPRGNDALSKVYVEPTTRCNLDCPMCIRHAWGEPLSDMSVQTYQAVLESLKHMSADNSGTSKPNARTAATLRSALSGCIAIQISRSFVARGYPWYPTAYPAMSRYSTLWSLSDFKNSLKSSGSSVAIVYPAQCLDMLEALMRRSGLPVCVLVQIVEQRRY